MYFYKIDAQMTNIQERAGQEEAESFARAIRARLILFYQNNNDGTIFITSISGNRLTMGAIARNATWLEKNIQNFLTVAELGCTKINIEEITLESLTSLLYISDNECYIGEPGYILKQFGIEDLLTRRNPFFTEHMLMEQVSKQKLLKMAKDLQCTGTLIPEIERIFQPAVDEAIGHPVHYLILSDNDIVRDGILNILLSALYTNGRIKNRRYSVASINEENCKEKECLALYESCTDGAVVVLLGDKSIGGLDRESMLMRAIFGNGDSDNDSGGSWLDKISRTARKYYDKTLTIFCLPHASEKVKTHIREQLGIITLVELTEDPLSEKQAKVYLRRSARERGVPSDKTLYKAIDSGQATYSTTELLRVFNVWYSKRLKTLTHPQYSQFESSTQISAKTIYSGDAFTELELLIGLGEAKKVIKQAVDYFKAQQLFRDRGFSGDRPSMHMIFTGSPGTAKTTVARLFARIMLDNGLLSVGELFEVGRADLVGKYVGWTAQKVRNKFNEAMGSVLFIDEAYSLLDEREGMYGDEAINTIVAEMENRREDIVVIFAVYPEKMEDFLKRNPGLRSRIAFHVPFADYNPEELLQILEVIAGKHGVELDGDVGEKLLPVLAAASREPDFGNGRYVRNLFEKARMKQAGRLLAMDVDSITSEQATRLVADDFEIPTITRAPIKRIGFDVA